MNLVGISIMIHKPSNHNPRSHTKTQHGGTHLDRIRIGVHVTDIFIAGIEQINDLNRS